MGVQELRGAHMSDQPSITCPDCGMRSYNPNDIAEGYCGHCHDWTSFQEPGQPWPHRKVTFSDEPDS